jgi:hypothetical protein
MRVKRSPKWEKKEADMGVKKAHPHAGGGVKRSPKWE